MYGFLRDLGLEGELKWLHNAKECTTAFQLLMKAAHQSWQTILFIGWS